MKIIESNLIHHFNGNIEGDNVTKTQKYFKDITSIYNNSNNIDPNTIMYEVYKINNDYDQNGSLEWGLSILHPVLINGECNMTKGHWHKDCSADEIYVCQSGEGLLLLMNDAGETWAQKMKAGSIHYISGQLAHRLVNTHNEALKVICTWPKNAGHDYNAVERLPFKYRIYKEKDELIFKEVHQTF